jgi:LmbE family N-acetylglucosaminyl deacetylase
VARIATREATAAARVTDVRDIIWLLHWQAWNGYVRGPRINAAYARRSPDPENGAVSGILALPVLSNC